MKRETYQRGLPGVKWGIWNCQRKCFQFSICEDTPMLAEARLYQKIGDDAKKWRFEPRQLPGKYATFSPVLYICFLRPFLCPKTEYAGMTVKPLQGLYSQTAESPVFYLSYRNLR